MPSFLSCMCAELHFLRPYKIDFTRLEGEKAFIYIPVSIYIA